MNQIYWAYRRMPFLLVLILAGFLFSCGNGGSDGGITRAPENWSRTVQLPAGASRTSGGAPLGVFFNAAVDSNTDVFHTRDYTWDFDDPGSGTWADSGISKNTDKGPVAAHIFEQPGNYTVRLTIRDSAGITGSETFDIQVEDADDRYAGVDTVCISSRAADDFNGCPTGALPILLDDIDDLVSDHNLLTGTPGLAGPDHADPLLRGFSLLVGSPAENQGIDVPVWDDYAGMLRPQGMYVDIGAFER